MFEAGLQRWEHIPTGGCGGLEASEYVGGKVTVIKFYDIKWFSCQRTRRIEANEKNRSGGYAHNRLNRRNTCTCYVTAFINNDL